MLVVCPDCVSAYRFDRAPAGEAPAARHCAHCRRPLEGGISDLPTLLEPPRETSAVPGLLFGLAVLALASGALFCHGPIAAALPTEVLSRLVGAAPAPTRPIVDHVTTRWDQDGLTVAGTVSNPGAASVSLPRIRIAVHDGTNQLLYSWTAAPPQPSLGPGQSVTFTSRLDKPPSAGHDLAVGFVRDRVASSDGMHDEAR